MSRNSRRGARIAGMAVVTALVGATTGCGVPPWLANGAGPSASPSASAPAGGEISVITNDLATGSTRRLLTAGAIELTVDYWSDLSMEKWTPEATKPVNLSMSATLAGDEGQEVYLSQLTLTSAVTGEGGALAAPAPLTDRASISPGYLVKAPYSYSQTFVLPAVESAVTSITLVFTYELLLQSTPTSSSYAKQTASDTLTIAIVQPEPSEGTPEGSNK